MANRSTKRPGAPQPAAKDPEINESSAKVVSLRIPESLHVQAKLCSDAYGVPVNALVCIALAEFLTEKGYRVHPSRK